MLIVVGYDVLVLFGQFDFANNDTTSASIALVVAALIDTTLQLEPILFVLSCWGP